MAAEIAAETQVVNLMNAVWLFLVVCGCAVALATGNVDAMMTSVFDGADSAIQLVISLAGLFCLWVGIEKLAEESGLIKALARVSRPLLGALFPELRGKPKPLGTISATIISNLLGLSSSTPLGTKAMQEIKESLRDEDDRLNSMIRLVVMSAAGFCFFPSTIIALRAALGSDAPAIVAGPSALAGLAATLGGLGFHWFCSKRRRER
jgi:spore maturation protein A